MSELKQIKRPPISLIKLVEAVGILLGVPRSTVKSKYKAPLPSNYDQTVELLSTNFYDKVSDLTSYLSSQIPNDVASVFYNKTLEPGFDYEDGVNAGGLMMRELFNVVYLVLLGLQTDKERVPVSNNNIAVFVDGTRASYGAFDSAAHVHDHGILQIINFTTVDSDNIIDEATAANREHLFNDVVRRCKSHFKKPDHGYQVHNLILPLNEVQSSLIDSVQHFITEQDCKILALGLNDPNLGADSSALLTMWGVWTFVGDVILCKGISTTRPFNTVSAPRNYLLYLDSKIEPKAAFLKALKYLKPGDSVVLYTVIESSEPVGDCRDLRFDFGARHGWVTDGKVDFTNGPSRPGWNDEDTEKLRNNLENMLTTSYLLGRVLLGHYNPEYSISQQLTQTAFNEAIDTIIVDLDGHHDVVIELAKECTCSMIVLK